MNAGLDLVAAVTAADLAAVESALRNGASPNTLSAGYTRTPVLTVTAWQGSVEIVEKLLVAGAMVNVSSEWGGTPLRAAATYGHAQVVARLLAAGADPNAASQQGSILMAAVASTRHWPTPASLECVRLLLDAGAEVRVQDDPAVVLAVSGRSPAAILGLFLDRGADANAVRSDGTPAIVIAAMRRETRLVDVLVAAGADVDLRDAGGRTALMHAVERGADDIVVSLLCAGADKDLTANDGSSAHDLALAWGRQSMRLMMGERSVGSELIDVPRTVIFQRASAIQLLGDQTVFDKLALFVDHAINDLGDDEFEILTGCSADAGRLVADRLRYGSIGRADSPVLRQIGVTRDEQLLIRGALLNLAYGPPMGMPPGITQAQMADIFEDFDEFVR